MKKGKRIKAFKGGIQPLPQLYGKNSSKSTVTRPVNIRGKNHEERRRGRTSQKKDTDKKD